MLFMMNLRGNVSMRMRVTRSKRIKFDLYVLGDSLSLKAADISLKEGHGHVHLVMRYIRVIETKRTHVETPPSIRDTPK